MRSLFVFPALERAEAVRRAGVAGARTDLPIGVSEADQRVLVWAELFEDLPARNFTPEDVAEVERVSGFRPTWGIEVAISGHLPDSRQRDVRILTTWLLSDGGCATSIDVDEFRTAQQWQEVWARD